MVERMKDVNILYSVICKSSSNNNNRLQYWKCELKRVAQQREGRKGRKPTDEERQNSRVVVVWGLCIFWPCPQWEIIRQRKQRSALVYCPTSASKKRTFRKTVLAKEFTANLGFTPNGYYSRLDRSIWAKFGHQNPWLITNLISHFHVIWLKTKPYFVEFLPNSYLYSYQLVIKVFDSKSV